MKIDEALTKEQNKLILKAKAKGVYENFGRAEVRKLEAKYIDSSLFTEEMNKRRRLIQLFSDWAMNYSG